MRRRTTAWWLLVCGLLMLSGEAPAQFGGNAGAFSRMGFGARGIGMGNAMSGVSTGDLVAYYNPAALPFAEDIQIAASFGILSLDRKLNFLSYTQPVHPSAGIAFGIINSGVSDIDGRNSDGEPTGDLHTSENQVFLAFANQFKGGLSLGITLKLYHHRLYTDVTSLIVALDFGGMVKVSDRLTVGASVRDINAEYKWDTSVLYGQDGNSTIDKFPLLYSVGASYTLPDSLGLVAVDIEASNRKTLLGRIGMEVPLVPELTVRAGLDRIDFREKGNGIRPVFGFTVRKGFGSWTPALNYAYVVEPFVSTGMHLISLSVVL